jgi:uncharacterized membrane-anchored protein YhcB (DUF1043 family)
MTLALIAAAWLAASIALGLALGALIHRNTTTTRRTPERPYETEALDALRAALDNRKEN